MSALIFPSRMSRCLSAGSKAEKCSAAVAAGIAEKRKDFLLSVRAMRCSPSIISRKFKKVIINAGEVGSAHPFPQYHLWKSRTHYAVKGEMEHSVQGLHDQKSISKSRCVSLLISLN